ncbi:hypothetical protein NEOKW01_1947 [Nematocida sp. AWRm80]|nr:hypothetical protein NEOKW01_1947 [Nematocida sp. AWRm80]
MLDEVLTQLKRRKVSTTDPSPPEQQPKEQSPEEQQPKEQPSESIPQSHSKSQILLERPSLENLTVEIISTQTEVPTIDSFLEKTKEKYHEQEIVTVNDIKNTKDLKMKGIFIGYITQIPSTDRAHSLKLSDGSEELFCALHSKVPIEHTLKKNTILVIETPSIWRLTYTLYTPVINIALDNIISVIDTPLVSTK